MRLARAIADALERGAAVLAANPRAARALQLDYAEAQRAAGRTFWPAPAIQHWDSWLRDLWRDHSFATPSAPLLLTPLQERALWTRVQHEDAALVLAPGAMAGLAMEAWSLLSAYLGQAARREPWDQADAERFRHWAAEFERACTRHGWLSASQLETSLVPLITGGSLSLPREVLLVGFDRFTPAQRQLRAALESRGAVVNEFRLEDPARPGERQWMVATDQRDEIAACAAWCRDILLADPAARIGIIVPAVASARGLIERTFRRVLMPATEDIRRPSVPMPFEFSLGQSLAGIPAIRAALLLLRWIASPLREEDISWLLLSGFVANTVTYSPALARHDAARRRTGSLVPRQFLESYRASLAGDPSLRPVHDFLGALNRAAQSNRVLDQDRQPSAWTEFAHLLLERAAWPGDTSADSFQFQALQRWQRLLDDLALLDFDGTRCSWSAFLDLLDLHAGETIFAPESHDAPIQIMGPLESSGQRFDAIWFLGADDDSWPLRGRLHPLLPPSVQCQFEMPHAIPEDDWNLAHAVTARLLASAPRIVFSYAQRSGDTELRPSPLIASLFPADAQPQPAPTSRPADLTPVLESIPDDSGVLPWPRERTPGGADVLRRQAACPFQAFAAKRLAAEPLEGWEWGLTALDQGKLLHEVLHRLFTASEPSPLRTRDDLVTAIATNQLSAILDAHIDAVFRTRFGSDPSDSWAAACIAAERRRLRTRLADWLALEATRQPFTVEACEQRLSDVHIGELRLHLRADRIDLLQDSTRLLIDYKTGRISPAAWQGERPEEPQLPLYAAYGNVENLSGILFAQIRAGEIRFDGRIADAQSQLCAGISSQKVLVTDPYSATMRDEWARVLEKLAADFLSGEAAVAPRDPQVCSQCGLHGLCRVAELSRSFVESAAEESADA